MTAGDIAGWVSTAIAAASFSFAVYAARSAKSSEAKTKALQLRNTELAERQAELSQRAWADAYFRDVTAWATAASQAISDGIHLEDDSDTPELRSILTRLSASIDTGRWYFPNSPGSDGESKEPAYRGLRQPILDHLVHAYQGLADLQGDKRYDRLVHCQRSFVSQVQLVLDPRARDRVMENVLREFREAENARSAA